ncbi:MAG: hypothetical protein IJ409_07785, partial [Lachnospiraceae bacterium]|nr:hypothetical protein [Lachnospiraceae bacterium]
PSQALQNMLKYIQESTKENATNDETIKVQEFVDKVKRRKEVGVNYMKSWEMEEWIKEQAYKEGHNEGYDAGHTEGIEKGIEKGIEQGIQKADKLYAILAEAGRTDDIIKATHNKTYQKELFTEFNL